MSPKRQVTARKGSNGRPGKTAEWYTPRWLLRELEYRFGPFELDPCAAVAWAAAAPRFFGPEQDGLLQPWAPARVFMNPPYGDGIIGRWLEKAWVEAQHGALVVCLVPAYTDSAWWHDWVLGKAEVRYIRGRLRFATEEGFNKRMDAPFGSALVIFHPHGSAFERRAGAAELHPPPGEMKAT